MKTLILFLLLSTMAGASTRTIDADAIRASNRATTLTLPAATDTLVGRATTDTLTNKTLTSPLFTSMTAGSIYFAGTSGLLSQDNSNLYWDNSTKQFAIGAAVSGNYRFLMQPSTDSYGYGMGLCGTGAGSTRCWELNPGANGFLVFRNPGGGFATLTLDNVGKSGINDQSPDAALDVNAELNRPTDPTLRVSAITSQSGDLFQAYNAGESVKLAYIDVLGNMTATSFTGPVTGNVTGNASTATALAANPSACGAGDFVSDIAANGTLTCGTPGGTPTFSGFRAYGSTTTISGTIADIVWTTESFDTATAFDGTTFTIPTTGKWLITVRMQFDQAAPVATKKWEIYLANSANAVLAEANDYAFSTSEQGMSETLTEIRSFTAADTVKVRAISEQTTPVIYDPFSNASNVFSAVYLGP